LEIENIVCHITLYNYGYKLFFIINQLDTLISQIYFGRKLYMFRTVSLSSSGVFHCTHRNGICHTGLLTACKIEELLHLVGLL
jgi:hypothetical protein